MEIQIPRRGIHWPGACSCCGAATTNTIKVRGSRGAFLLVAAYEETLTVEAPYCDTCADHANVFEKGTFGGLLYPSVLIMAGAFITGIFALGSVENPSRSTELALMLGAPGAAPLFYVAARLIRRYQVAVGPPHASKGMAVRVVSWNPDVLLLSFANEAYAARLLRENRGQS